MDKIEELLTRGVEKIYPSKEELEKVLRSGKKLKLYQGFDPTGSQLHIGHMIGLRKLKKWQDLGHHVIFLIGDGTGQAGDPSGKTKSRNTFFNQAELRKNAIDYVKQAGKVVRFKGKNPVQILFNSDWLNKMTLTDILDLANHFSVQQLIERDIFQERVKRNESINLREFLYPILQAKDSVEMKVDLELGGTDQTFNMLEGRRLLKEFHNMDKFVMTTPLLTDSKGVKIGKTEGNVIALNNKPEDLYGKIMALPDDVITKGFEYLTDVYAQQIQNMKRAIDRGESPMKYKKMLAFEIVKQLNTEKDAKTAQENFEKIVQEKEIPKDIPVFKYAGKRQTNIVDLLIRLRLARSKSQAKQLVEQGGVAIDGNQISNIKNQILIGSGTVIKVGKRRYIKVKL